MLKVSSSHQTGYLPLIKNSKANTNDQIKTKVGFSLLSKLINTLTLLYQVMG